MSELHKELRINEPLLRFIGMGWDSFAHKHKDTSRNLFGKGFLISNAFKYLVYSYMGSS